MEEAIRDRLWVGALAIARQQRSFMVSEVLELADVDASHRDTAEAVLATMAEYGFIQSDPAEATWRAGSAVPLTDPNPTGFDGTFTYLTAPKSRWIFDPPVVREWVESRLDGRVLNLFAGPTKLSHDGEIVRNDVDETIEATYHVNAADIAAHVEAESFGTIVLDPPLIARAPTDGQTTQPAGHTIAPADLDRIKTQVAELVEGGGTVITFGRNSSGLGSTRGFEKREICLINHPGSFDDTIAVVEGRIDGEVE
ncbi:MAG: hypothetical protein ABEH65_09820 [Halobacteriales archaeon]